ncbi:MAG: hypothetical protein FWB79_01460 [Treponema sp.]|nr:hypothetical protein [Treponema sp.]
METEKSRFSRRPFPRLLVLVPHRDARLPMRAWSGSLFAAGLPGAWSFPWVAPLAALDRGLSRGELKSLSRALRERNDRLTAGPPALAPVPLGDGQAFAFGPSLDLALPDGFFRPRDAISPTVLGAALLHGPAPGGLPEPPRVSFRAAALAVARFRPLPGGGLSLEWEIGELHWLPKRAGNS